MKLKINRDLYEKLYRCRKSMRESMKYYATDAINKHLSGFLDGVAHDDTLTDATRENSTVITIADTDLDPQTIRIALAKAVAYAEPLIPTPFKTDLRKDIDYKTR